MRRILPILSGALLLCATSASAGPLISASISTTVSGASLTLVGGGTGSLDGAGNFTYNGGSSFSGLFSDPAPVTSMGGTVTAAGGAAQITAITIMFGNGPNGISGNTGTTGSLGTAGLTGTGKASGNVPALGQFGVQLAAIQVSYGGGGTFVQPPFLLTAFGAVTLATINIAQPTGDLWHLGATTATGLTSTAISSMGAQTMSVMGGTAMATGGISVTGGGNTVITLVTLAKSSLATNGGTGSSMSIGATPVFLTLTYGPTVPEPGTLLLLGSGLAGLVLVGRRKA